MNVNRMGQSIRPFGARTGREKQTERRTQLISTAWLVVDCAFSALIQSHVNLLLVKLFRDPQIFLVHVPIQSQNLNNH